MFVQDKPALFKSFYKWLKPGGKVLITDYCRKSGSPSEEFAKYIKQRGYDLHDVETYGQMLRDAGFEDVIAEDRTEQVHLLLLFVCHNHLSYNLYVHLGRGNNKALPLIPVHKRSSKGIRYC